MFLNCYSPLFQSPQNVIFMVSVAFMQIPKLSRRTAAEAPPPPKPPARAVGLPPKLQASVGGARRSPAAPPDCLQGSHTAN